MAGNNLQIRNTGLDHCYMNGIPIVEAELDISEIFKKVARISSIAVQGDSFFDGKSSVQKAFSESHGEGDRISSDFLEEGARDLLPIFSPFQRLIPEGVYDTTPVEYDFAGQTSDFSWTNPDPENIFINNIQVRCISGNGDIAFVVNGDELGVITLPDFEVDHVNYLAYDLSGFLGGEGVHYYSYVESQNVRDNNVAQVIECLVSNNTNDFVYDIKICGSKYDAIGWIKALTEKGDVHLPSYKDDIRISNLIKEFEWSNINQVHVVGVTLRHISGSSFVTIKQNGVDGVNKFLDKNTIGENIVVDIDMLSVVLDESTDDFCYDLIINTELPKFIPSPGFEFNSTWNPGKIIFRYQNMDSRDSDNKLNYTSETLRDIRVDPNVFANVVKYLNDALKNYVLKELYLATGYDKKAVYYERKYEIARKDAKFWLRSEKGLQTQYHYAGV